MVSMYDLFIGKYILFLKREKEKAKYYRQPNNIIFKYRSHVEKQNKYNTFFRWIHLKVYMYYFSHAQNFKYLLTAQEISIYSICSNSMSTAMLLQICFVLDAYLCKSSVSFVDIFSTKKL